jgi:hypothetical protein
MIFVCYAWFRVGFTRGSGVLEPLRHVAGVLNIFLCPTSGEQVGPYHKWTCSAS